MGTRHNGRELALKALYQIDLRGGASTDDLALFFETFPAEDLARKFAVTLVEACAENRLRSIARSPTFSSIGRLDGSSRVDHNILRLAIFELLRMEDIPARVTIDEAIELAKAYGDQESGRFVNGVLDQVASRLRLEG